MIRTTNGRPYGYLISLTADDYNFFLNEKVICESIIAISIRTQPMVMVREGSFNSMIHSKIVAKSPSVANRIDATAGGVCFCPTT